MVRRPASLWGCNADSHHQARHDLSLPAAGRVRRAPHDAASARRWRPDGARSPALDITPEPSRACLDAGCLRQSCRDRPLRRPGARTSLRKHDRSSTTRRRLPRSRYRRPCPDLSVHLCGGRSARPRALTCAPTAAPRTRSLGGGLPARRRIGRHARAARRHDADHQAHLQACGAAPEGHRRTRSQTLRSRAEAAAISRC